MRKLIGCLLLIVGIGGLGYVATTHHALRIQSMIGADAVTVAASARHNVQARVSGRDISVMGVVTDPSELAGLRAGLQSIPGVRAVDVSGVSTLQIAAPFAVTAIWSDGGSLALSGVIPSDAARDVLAQTAGEAVAGLTLAAGAPDDDWASVVAQTVAAVTLLKSGQVEVSDRDILLSGLARDPEVVAMALGALDGVPSGYTLTTDIDVEDDGTPLRLALSLSEGRVSGEGKFPADMDQSRVTDRFTAGEIHIVQASLPAVDPDWPRAVEMAMDALLQLTDATLEVVGRRISLIGRGTPDAIARAADLLGGLPQGYAATSDLTLWDDGAPFAMTLLWDGSSATAEGKFPAGFTPSGPADVAVESTADYSFLTDDTGDFAANVAAGTHALGFMTSGTLQATSKDITLIGTAASPQIGLAMDSALADAATGTTINRDIIYLDDGSPAAWTLSYAAATGAQIEGRLPVGLGLEELSQGLGVAEISGSPTAALEDADTGNILESLQIVADYLPEIETMTFAHDGGMHLLDLVLSPGVDLDLVANDLAERLPPDLAFALSPLEDLPADGTTRINAATGNGEKFARGFWLPDLDFKTDVAGCSTQTAAILDRGQIVFLSASARLEATSIRAINALASVILPCVAADLSLEVGGHTDTSGDELENVALSQARADAVQDALIARGVPVDALTAYGFGQSQPIADNETPEGRAANRRTDITWFAPGDLRDP